MAGRSIGIRNWLERVLFVASTVFLVVSANFGLSLFFSINRDILNPQVHLWPVAVKDGAWLGLIGLVVLWRLVAGKFKPDWPVGGTVIWTAALISLLIAGLVLLQRDGFGLDVNYIRSLKNYVFYQLLPYLFVFLAPLDLNLRKILFWAMVSALSVSCAVYGLEPGFKPGNAADPRMYGSMGNPNAVGLVAAMVLIVLLSEWNRSPLPGRLLILSLVWGVTGLSASFSAIMVIAVTLICKTIELLWSRDLKRTTAFVAQVVATLLVVKAALWLAFGLRTPLFMRVSSATELINQGSSLEQMDSIAVRAEDWTASPEVGISAYRQYDSAIQTFIANYGVPGAVMIMLPVLLVIWGLLTKARRPTMVRQNWQFEIFGCVVIFVLSGLLQYQMSHFPTNLLLNLTVALLVRDIVMGARAQNGTTETGSSGFHVWEGAR